MLLVASALIAALASLHVVLQGISWWVAGTVFAIIVLAARGWARHALRSRWWPPIAAVLVVVLALTVGFARDTALLWIVPTPSTPGGLVDLGRQGIASIIEQVIPARPEPGIVLLIAVLMAASAWFADAVVTAGRAALVALPLGIILAVPLAVLPGLVDPLWFVVTVLLYLGILRIGRPRESRPLTLAVAGVAVIAGFVLPTMLPQIGTSLGSGASGFAAGINPIITLGDDLRRGNPSLALRYTSTAVNPVYLRLSTLSSFTGDSWEPEKGVRHGAGLEELPAPRGLWDDTATSQAEVEVTVADIRTGWLPLPYPSTSVSGLDGDWFYQPEGLTVRSERSNASGQHYVANFLEVWPSEEQLGYTQIGLTPSPEMLELPADRPEIIRALAYEWTADAPSTFDKALALQNYLRGPNFSYSEQTPVDEGFDGSGLDALAVFLDQRTGYCVHFASAMAVMARELGIPSRVVVGFQPGERTVADGRVLFEVQTDDLHAWPELYFEPLGWMRFEPTPSRGVTPDYLLAAEEQPTPDEDATPEPTTQPTEAPQDEAEARDETETVTAAEGESSGELLMRVASVLAVVAAVAAVVLVPAAVRGGIRARRMWRIRHAREPAAAAWSELRDTARDVGWAAPGTETVRALTKRLEPAMVPDAVGVFRSAASAIERVAYGRAVGQLSARQLHEARLAILRTAATGTRVRGFLLPRSLFARLRSAPEA